MTVKLEVYTSKTCPYCPMAEEAAQAAVKELGDVVEYEHLDVDENMDKVRQHQIMSVPTVVIDDEVAFIGAPQASELIEKIKTKL